MVAEPHGLRFSLARAQRWSAQQLRPGSPLPNGPALRATGT